MASPTSPRSALPRPMPSTRTHSRSRSEAEEACERRAPYVVSSASGQGVQEVLQALLTVIDRGEGRGGAGPGPRKSGIREP